ncbi:MAG TPA: hypothetical protein VLE27_09065 [Thermoanaerobaculia bacterium]|nr:hypothetical protein [Thermoanaerobaculia bacterium]
MKKIVLVLALVLLASAPAFAERVIYNGSDLWTTPGDGRTFTDFSLEPIPAGFFCSKSAPFTGRVAFKGVPVATAKPGALGKTDTIIQRLDDAAFNKKGVAVTRLQVRALSLESIEPIKTACGLYKAVATLDGGPQPVTRMRIIRTHEKGGHFLAPLALNVRVTFIPAGGNTSTEKLELRQTVRFSAQPKPWESAPGRMQEKAGMYLVDTDGDRVADTYVPGTSNFVLRGVDRSKITYTARQPSEPTIDPTTGYNHTAPTHAHLVTTTIDTQSIN